MTLNLLRLRHSSIRYKLLLLFVVVVALPAGLTIFLCDRITRGVVLEQNRDAARLDAAAVSTTMQSAVRDLIAHVRAYANTLGGPYCHAEDVLDTPHVRQGLSRGALAVLRGYPDFLSVAVFQRPDHMLVSQTSRAGAEGVFHLQALRPAWAGKSVVTGPFTHDTFANAFLEIGTPVLDADGSVVAVVVAKVKFSAVLAAFPPIQDPWKDERVILLDGDGIRIWDSVSTEDLLKPAVALSQHRIEQIRSSHRFGLSTQSLLASRAPIPGYTAEQSPHGPEAFFDTRMDGEDFKGFVGEVDIPGERWRVLYLVENSDFYGPLARTNAVISYVSIGAAVAALLMGIGLSRVITRPISVLSGALDEFAKGNTEVSLDCERADEFGTLTNSFNQMVVSVKSFQYEVEQQNRDLSEANRSMRLLNAGLEATVHERTREIEKEKEKLDTVVGSIAVALSILDEQMQVTWTNRIGRKGFRGIRRLRTRHDITTETGATCAWPVEQTLREGQTRTETFLVESEDKGNSWWQVTAVPMPDAEGRVEAVLEMVQDVSEQKQVAQKILQAEKMSSVGYLASGIAHEFNNIMCAILGHANLARTDPTRLGRLIDVVVRQCDRAAKITQGLLSMSRRKESVMQYSDLLALTDEVVTLLENEVSKEQIELVRTYRGEAKTLVNPSHYQQAMLSLIINARQAIGRNGRIEIVIESSDKQIDIRVMDNGCGITPEHKAKLFEPFFTTKGALGGGDKPGTGLGLSAVYNIITNHGGTIEVDSQVGVGTTFVLTLPVRQERRRVETPVAKDRRVPDTTSRPLRVLVVDDEEDLRTLLKTMLTLEKHEVSLAENAEQALEMTAKSAFDCVFLDLTMPGPVDSWTALEEIKRTAPDTQVVIVSGTAAPDSNSVSALDDADGFLHKPFESEQICAILDRIAQRRASTTQRL